MIPNFDPETGIHYGVIGANSIMPEVVSDIYDSAVDEDYEYAESQISDAVKDMVGELSDYIDREDATSLELEVLAMVWERFDYEPNEPLMRYEKDGYLLLYSTSSNTITVCKSQYYTKCRPCSPCYPNAGDLDTPDIDTGLDTYCLGDDFFENDEAPYIMVEVRNNVQP